MPAREAVSPELLSYVRGRLPEGTNRVTATTVAGLLAGCGVIVDAETLAETTAAVRAELTGAGPLQALLDRPEVTDVLVNGTAGVWADTGGGLRRTNIRFDCAEDVRRLAVRLAAAGGRRLDDAAPTVDARLPDGTRLHAVLPPVAPDGPLVSLRTMRARAFTVTDLVTAGTIPQCWVSMFRGLMQARASFLISGATGSGKTTLLAALLSLTAGNERIALLEESPELEPNHPHVIRLQTRRANVEGEGAIGLAQLVREALRMRPDRIVVGECRGPELRELLSALNTGHDGGAGTIHSNAAADVPARLAALGALAGLDRDAVMVQALSALRVVLHVLRDQRSQRRQVRQWACLAERAGRLVSIPALTWHPEIAGVAECPRWPTVSGGPAEPGVPPDDALRETRPARDAYADSPAETHVAPTGTASRASDRSTAGHCPHGVLRGKGWYDLVRVIIGGQS